MGFYGDGDSKAFANIENMFGNIYEYGKGVSGVCQGKHM